MIHNTQIPAPLRRKMLLTSVIGIACFLIGFAFFLFCKDQTMLLLSLAVFVMCIGKTITLHRIVSMQSYETIEGTCAFIAPQLLRRYRKVKIIDNEGNETSLLLDKHSKIQLGSRYKFYFKEADRLTLGKEYFDSVLNADCFLGFEEVGIVSDT